MLRVFLDNMKTLFSLEMWLTSTLPRMVFFLLSRPTIVTFKKIPDSTSHENDCKIFISNICLEVNIWVEELRVRHGFSITFQGLFWTLLLPALTNPQAYTYTQHPHMLLPLLV